MERKECASPAGPLAYSEDADSPSGDGMQNVHLPVSDDEPLLSTPDTGLIKITAKEKIVEQIRRSCTLVSCVIALGIVFLVITIVITFSVLIAIDRNNHYATETKVAALAKAVSGIKAELKAYGVDEDALKRNVSNLKARQSRNDENEALLGKNISALEAKFAAYSVKDEALRKNLSSVQERLAEYRALEAMLAKNVSDLRRKEAVLDDYIREIVREMKSNISRLYRLIEDETHRENISFLAIHDRSQTVSAYGSVQFNTVLLDYGAGGYGYNVTTGKYRCPSAGLYSFVFGAATNKCGESFSFGIIRGNRVVTSTSAATILFFCGSLTLSASALTTCGQGQHVYVKELLGFSPQIYSNNNGYTYFGGFIIN